MQFLCTHRRISFAVRGLDAYTRALERHATAIALWKNGGPMDENAQNGSSLLASSNISADASETPCFTPGTMIATDMGEVLVEDLKEGDKVVTRDNGLQTVRWVGRRRYLGRELARNPHLYPVLIRKGALGEGLPERDMRLSPNHRVLVAGDLTALYFEEREVLASAKHLVNHRGVYEVESLGTVYLHILFDKHEVVLSNGCWSESFQPSDRSLTGLGNAQRQEILEIFPDIIGAANGMRPARRILSEQEAHRLFEGQ